MKKESKNLGLSKACPSCRKTLIKSANIIGVGNFKTKCPHCGSLIKVEIGQKSFITLTKVSICLLLVIGIYQIITIIGVKNSVATIINSYEIISK